MCGSQDVGLLVETMPPPPVALDPEQAEQVSESLIDFLRAGAAWFRQNTDTVRDRIE
jgi:hypothetical protein